MSDQTNQSLLLESENISPIHSEEPHGTSLSDTNAAKIDESIFNNAPEREIAQAAATAVRRPHTFQFDWYHEIGIIRKAGRHLKEASDKNRAYGHDSTAVKSLRRHSEAKSVVSAGIPLLQSAGVTLHALFTSQNRGPLDDSSDKTNDPRTSYVKRKRAAPHVSHAAGNRQGAKIKQNVDTAASLTVPATIILRKASEARYMEPTTGTDNQCVAAEMLHEDGGVVRAAACALAVHSQQLDSRRFSSFERHKIRTMSSPKDSTNHPLTMEQRAKSVAGLSGLSGSHQHGLAAERTLTPEEARLSPDGFIIRSNSRRQSVSAADSLRRFSVIRAGVNVRGSVHEIIWHEDETSSSASSPVSVDSVENGSLATKSLERKTSPDDITATELSSLPKASARKNSFSLERKQSIFQGDLFDWSWNKQSTGASRSPAPEPFTAVIREGADEVRDRRPSISKSCRIHSFPPLNPRQNTSEWRLAPLPDLNDPIIDQAPCEILEPKYLDGVGSLMDRGLEMYSSIPGAVRASVAPDVDAGLVTQVADTQFEYSHAGLESVVVEGNTGPGYKRSKSVSGAPLAPGRVGEVGKMGGAIGVSSRKRFRR